MLPEDTRSDKLVEAPLSTPIASLCSSCHKPQGGQSTGLRGPLLPTPRALCEVSVSPELPQGTRDSLVDMGGRLGANSTVCLAAIDKACLWADSRTQGINSRYKGCSRVIRAGQGCTEWQRTLPGHAISLPSSPRVVRPPTPPFHGQRKTHHVSKWQPQHLPGRVGVRGVWASSA